MANSWRGRGFAFSVTSSRGAAPRLFVASVSPKLPLMRPRPGSKPAWPRVREQLGRVVFSFADRRSGTA